MSNSNNPMFPRLHVNDADKGGPRAPPRNKMALYEQLSIPSNKFTSSNSPHDQANGHERADFTQSPSLPHLNEKANSRLIEKRSTKIAIFKSGNAAGSVAKCNSSAQHESTQNNSCQKRVNDDDNDFMVPTFLNSENALPLSKEAASVTSKNPSNLHANIAQKERSDRKLGQHERTSNKRKLNDSEYTEYREKHPGQNSCGNTQSKLESNKTLDKHRSMNVNDICSQADKEKDDMLHESEVADEISDPSKCVTGVEISPDDVVEVIGPKQFWKARRAIINQQRLFAAQVFELHRLMKVQKSLAASPHLLLDSHSSCIAPQKIPINSFSKPPSHPTSQKDENTPQTQTYNNNSSSNNTDKPPPIPLPPQETTHRPNYPWCYPPPTQQWLVPVISPSEGLIYKPYSPASGTPLPSQPNFMPSFYNSAYNYSTLPVEQNSRSSCNMSLPKSHYNNNNSKGSTASCPSGRGALPLFPTGIAPGEGNNVEEQQTVSARVIRVVPHDNARSATESAARIFRSIQEERQQHQLDR